jgi:diguanylate cyclase (GGDEF)-like protein
VRPVRTSSRLDPSEVALVNGPGARKLVSDPSLALDSGRASQRAYSDSAERSFNGEETIVASSPLHRAAGHLEAHLIVIAHPLEHCLGRRYSLKPGTVLDVGRAADAEIGFPEVPSISRRHARVSYLSEGVCLEDIGSRNGTFLNNHLVQGREWLQSGDRFQIGAVVFKFLMEEDAEHAYHEAIHQMVICDGLTDLFNRRKFQEEFEGEYNRARRYGRPLSLILFDVDHFKRINDSVGHLAGDAVLQGIARLVKEITRREQVVARIGGEEFAILCPETPVDGATALAEKLRAAFAAEIIEIPGHNSISITCSFGVADVKPRMENSTALFTTTDRALYQAKAEGRNRVITIT